MNDVLFKWSLITSYISSLLRYPQQRHIITSYIESQMMVYCLQCDDDDADDDDYN